MLASGLVFVGILMLVAALCTVRTLVARLPQGALRRYWSALTALIVLFVVAYLGYAVVFWNRHTAFLDFIVPVVFFFGACFVFLTTSLSLRTARDVLRISALERETVTDSLTGVLNRRYLDRRLNEQISSARRYGQPLSVVMLDIDNFKEINDSYGHQAGDGVLAALGEIVATDLRQSDVLVRYGGEEFLIITPITDLSHAADIAERVRRRIASHDFGVRNEKGESASISVTVSMGVASLGDSTESMEKLVQAADENLYRAKREGRNRVVAGTTGTPTGVISSSAIAAGRRDSAHIDEAFPRRAG